MGLSSLEPVKVTVESLQSLSCKLNNLTLTLWGRFPKQVVVLLPYKRKL